MQMTKVAPLGLVLVMAGCALAPVPPAPPALPPGPGRVQLPVLKGWFDGEVVLYVTTDISHADVAAAKGANFAPRLAHALPGGPPSRAGRRRSTRSMP